MKLRVLMLFCIFWVFTVSVGAEVINLKQKTQSNSLERTEILDLLRSKVKKDFGLEVVFIVNHFKMSKNYAWLLLDAQSKTSKALQLPESDMPYDCCHVEALVEKKNGKWQIKEMGAFSTDVWWSDIQQKYPNVDSAVFDVD
ncbi:hypothetical protein LPTSP4_23630 [Leptospira ryugenii]|uniref:Uncharacterized protein n=1 Tax=Leptospira ryugenii TaxID=1917863 RepID=A0A2P2E210_9LEPT|nr:hypothetical protein [Leptospira ryugenii]GBF50836.1 hypothetical protein LPTSP4_23630 [Leptospira ryugenii]